MDKLPPPAPANRPMGPMRHGAPVVKPKDLRGTLTRLWALTKGQRRGLGWIFLLSALASGSAVLSPMLIGTAVNYIDSGSSVSFLLLLLLGLYVSDWLVRFLQQFFMASIAQNIILHIRTAVFSAMKKLPLAYFDRRQHGELMSRLTNDVDNISTTISDSLSQLMVYAFTIVGIFCTMLSLNPLLTAVASFFVLFIFVLTRLITKHTRKLFAKQQSILGKLNGQVEESISGLTMVKAFCREQEMIEEFEKNNSEFCETATKALIWSGYLMPITNVINNLSYVFIAIISGILAVQGQISIGMISSFLLYSKQFSRPFVDIANIYNNFQTAVAGAERIFSVLDEAPEPEDLPNALPLSRPKGNIELRNVSFGYDPQKPVLKNISLSIPAGTRAAIVGPTGAGKTTIINLLTRFYDVDSGQILLDGHDLREYKMADLRKAFGVVLQDSALFGMSVRENIAYGRVDCPMSRLRRAACTAGADPFIQRLPAGYDTQLTGSGAALSQGERQLLTIARAVLADAPILILDEATSSVDTMTEQRIRSAMLAVTKGRTSFIIAHRLSTIRDSDLIVLIDSKGIAEQGTHKQLMALNGKYAKMYLTQSGENY